jgi:hypothetical protein
VIVVTVTLVSAVDGSARQAHRVFAEVREILRERMRVLSRFKP